MMPQLNRKILIPVFIAFVLASVSYRYNDIFIDFADEGFLWYGALEVLRGRVPILDFQAYDPGRYYWCAAVLSIFGKGLMSLRLAAGLFQFLSLTLGLLALRRVVASFWVLSVFGLLVVFFMLVPCRYFNAGLAPIALFFAVRLVEKPSFGRHFAAGICAGVTVFFAVNQGLYAFAGFSALMLYLNVKGRIERGPGKYLCYLAGSAAGLLPLWGMMAFIPGFFESYWQRMAGILWAFSSGRADVSFPVPWPWTVDWAGITASLPDSGARLFEFTNRFAIGLLFVFTSVWYLFSIPALARLKNPAEGPRALFTASVFIGGSYLGHIFARSDLLYLGEGIFPVISALLAWQAFARAPWRRICWGLLAVFAAAAFFSAGLRSTLAFKTMVPKGGMVWHRVGQDRIWLTHSDAAYINSFKKLVSENVGPQEPILLAPLLTTFYCLLERESPVYELYFHIAPTPAMEERVLRQMEEKNVRWAVVADVLVDGHPEQALSRSHPLLWAYLNDHFEKVTNEGLRPGYFLLKRKS